MKQADFEQKIKELISEALEGEKVEIYFHENLPAVRQRALSACLTSCPSTKSDFVCTSKSERRHYRTTSLSLSVRVVAGNASDIADKITSWLEDENLTPRGIQYSLISPPKNQTRLDAPKAGIFRYDFDILLNFTYRRQRPRNLITEVTDQTGVIYGREH